MNKTGSTRTPPTKRTTRRNTELKEILEARRKELTAVVTDMIRDVRSRSGDDRAIVDVQEGSDTDSQDDLDLALIQMKAETLRRIDTALQRIDAGTYGDCVECGRGISSERLRALPFAVRCTSCEDAREQTTEGALSRRARRTNPYMALDVAE